MTENGIKRRKMDKEFSIVHKANGGGTYSRRIGYIDALKGFGILCVVIGHAALGYRGNGNIPGSPEFWYAMENLIYAFHMPLFFCISGYVYRKAYFNGDGYVRKSKLLRQFLNLLLVYVLFSVLFTVVKIPFNAVSNEKSHLSDILWIWMRPVGVYWYLYVLMELYLLFAVSGVVRMRQSAMLLLCMILAVCSYYVSGPFQISRILYYTFFFSAGIAYASGFPLFSKGDGVILSFGVSVFLLVLYWKNEILLVDIPYVNILSAIGFSMIIWYIFEKIKCIQENVFLQYCGRHSLEIYVIHSIPVTAARVLMNKVGIASQYVSLTGVAVAGVSFPIIIVNIIKKMHLYDCFFRPASYLCHLNKTFIKFKNR